MKAIKYNIFLVMLIVISITGIAQSSWMPVGNPITGADGETIGSTVKLSANGKIMAIGAPNETSLKGIVRVYEWKESSWSQMGLDLLGEVDGDSFGDGLSLDSAGTTLAVGARNSSAGFGDYTFSGKVYIYSWNGSSWEAKGDTIIAKAAQENFGDAVQLSNDGNTIAIGVPGSDGDGIGRGAARVYNYNDSKWIQRGDDFQGKTDFDTYGMDVTLSGNGKVFASGASLNGFVTVFHWDGNTWVSRDTILGNEASTIRLSNDGSRLVIGTEPFFGGNGTVKVFDWLESSWKQLGTTITSPYEVDGFGRPIAFSRDGNFLALGADIGYEGDYSGRVEIYKWNGNTWEGLGDTLTGEYDYDAFGQGLAIADSGNFIAIGAPIHQAGGADRGEVIVLKYNNCDGFSVNLGDDVSVCDSTLLDAGILGAMYVWSDDSDSQTLKVKNSGTYFVDVMQDGCLASDTIKVIINTPNSGDTTATICKSFTWYGTEYTESSKPTHKLTNINGCDSVVTLDLTIFYFSGDINCNGIYDELEIAGDENGNGEIDGSEIAGDINGDGVIKTPEIEGDANGNGKLDCSDYTLLDQELDLTVSLSGIILTSSQADVSYQWIYCDSLNKPVEGATEQTFKPKYNGNYAVILTQEGCIDTTECFSVKAVDSSYVIWSEDFSANGWPGTVKEDGQGYIYDQNKPLPKGWSMGDDFDLDFFWHWSDVGPRGAYTQGADNDPFTPANELITKPKDSVDSFFDEASLDNGFLMFENDFYNTTPGGVISSDYKDHEAWIMYGPIDFSDEDSAIFNIKTIYRFCCWGDTRIVLQISSEKDNSGEHIWGEEYRFNKITQNNEHTAREERDRYFDVSKDIANKSEVYFRLYLHKASHYYTIIDDINFHTPGAGSGYNPESDSTSDSSKLSVQLYDLLDKLNVYPNPSNGTLYIEQDFDNCLLQITSLDGNLIKSINLDTPKTLIDLDAPAGIYNFTIISGSSIVNKKVVLIE